MKIKTLFLFMICHSFLALAQTPDTLKMNLPNAEELFVNHNLLLLAQKYNIEGSKGAILQAKLLPNPNVNFEQTLHAQKTIANNDRIAGFGERVLQVQQLILMAGKRNKQVKIQEINSEITEYQFNELLRELVYQLRSNFYQIYFLNKSLSMYSSEIVTMNRLVSAYQDQYLKGNVPYKEVVRLTSFLLTLESEKSKFISQIIDAQTAIKVLLGMSDNTYFSPIVDENQLDLLTVKKLNVANLMDIASENRFDQKLQEANVRLEQANYSFQKALAKPDFVVGYSFDKAGSYVNNYSALTFSMPVPVFNKNQGNIKIAENRIRASEQNYKQAQVGVANDVTNAINKAIQTENLYRVFDKNFVTNYETLIKGVIENYQKRNISLIEFTDFIESYKNAVNQVNSLQNDRMQAYELINFASGQKVL